MGRGFVRRVLGGNSAEEITEKRFDTYYALVFAYILSKVGNPGRARDLVTEALVAALSGAAETSEERFRVELFSRARQLCGREVRSVPLDFGLSEIERDALALMIDGRLTGAEAAAVCGRKNPASDLQRALSRLADEAATPEIPSFYRAG